MMRTILRKIAGIVEGSLGIYLGYAILTDFWEMGLIGALPLAVLAVAAVRCGLRDFDGAKCSCPACSPHKGL